jgi:DNA repair protein RecO (recombination protein O)
MKASALSAEASERDTAVVLHVRAYGDRDAIVSLLTRRHGRVTIFARGQRGEKRNANPPFCPAYELSLELRRRVGSELHVASAIDLVNPHLGLGERLDAFAGASVLLEDCRELLAEGDADEAVYTLLCAALGALEKGRRSPAAVVRDFEQALIGELGYEQPEEADGEAAFDQHTQLFERLLGRRLKARAFFLEVAK